MSRLTMEGNSGMSRIPRFAPGNRNMLQPNVFNHQQPLPGVGTRQNPSRLEQMQMEYQKNILKQKEEKLINMYEDQQKRALQKVNQNRGMVREFFDERRANSGGSTNSSVGPSMEQMYQKKKQEYRSGYNTNSVTSRTNSGNFYRKPDVNNKTVGRDRAKPLAPIHHNNNNNNDESENPFARRKPQIVRPRTYKDKPPSREYSGKLSVPRSAPNGYHHENFDLDFDDSPPPNNQQLQHLQQKRKMLQSQRQSNKAMMAQKNPQNTRKTPQSNRNPYNEYHTSEEDEGFDDQSEDRSVNDEMRRKQEELLAQIESQKRELDRLRHEREAAENEERRDRERRKKLEEERRQRMIEEEKRRQKQEEEERMRQQWEEEKQQKMELEKRRMRDVSRNSNVSSINDRRNNYHDDHSPTPPPKPKPTKTRKVVPNKPPQRQPIQEQPVVSGNHTALYEDAGNIEGAYEDTGRLVSCHNCGRRFAEDRLAKHEKACKNATKKRKVMDPSKLRTRGTEMEQFVAHRQPTPPKAKKKKDWRAQHENFIQTIRYAKKAKAIEESGGNLADLAPPPPTENPDYVQCPYCARKFNETAAERHIPHCKNTANRPKPPPKRRR